MGLEMTNYMPMPMPPLPTASHCAQQLPDGSLVRYPDFHATIQPNPYQTLSVACYIWQRPETFAEAKRRKERELYNGLSPYKIRRLNSKCYREKQHEYVLLLRRQSEKDQQRRAVYENGKTILKRLQRHASRTTSISPQSQSKCPLYTCPKKLRHLKKKRQVNRKFRKHESKEFSKCYPGYQSSVDDDDNIANVSFISNQTGRSRSPFPISSGSESSA